MLRRAVAAVLATALVLSVPALPAGAATPPAPADDGVSVAELDLAGVEPAGLATLPATPPVPVEDAPADGTASAWQEPADAPDPDVLTTELDTEPFTVLGVTWDPSPGLADVVIRYRVREHGTWTPWAAVGPSDLAPDADRGEAPDASTRGAIDPVVADDADGLQLWAEAGAGTVTGLTAVLIDPGEDPEPVGESLAAVAVPGRPAIISRAQWGADESMRTCEPDYSTQMVSAAIHHTASSNGYSADAVPGILRGFLAYHTRPEASGGRGWCDIGYNFLVDRFGRVFEGRAGGVTRTVVGVHTGGFNSRTIGVAAIGEFGSTPAPPAMTDAIVSLVAWKFSVHGITAGTSVSMVSGGGSSKHPQGAVVSFPTIYGHRDAQLTSCPGQVLYDLLPTIRSRVAQAANAAVAVSPRGVWDSTEVTPTGFTVSGWALDPETAAPVTLEIDVDGQVTTATADVDRPDIAALYPGLGSRHGFRVAVPRAPGSPLVCLRAVNIGAGTTVSLGCRRVQVRNTPPIGAVDSVTATPTGVVVTGWALDPDTSASNDVHLYVGDVGAVVRADLPRPDVAAIYGRGDRHGFTHTRSLEPGSHRVCVFSIDTDGGANALLHCSTVVVAGTPVARTAPIGALDSVSASSTGITVGGWALDPDTSTPVTVRVDVDGAATTVLADLRRPDVAAVHGTGGRHGFTHTSRAAPGPHSVCVHALNTGPGADTPLGCRTVEVPDAAPIGSLDAVVATNTTIAVSGWTLDPDTTDPTEVHVYVGGVGTALVADAPRPDVAAAYGRGDRHGFSRALPAAPGPHLVCAFGINTSRGPHTLLGCRTVVVPDAVPIGALDGVSTAPGTITVAGWTLDPDTTASNPVHVYVDGIGTALVASLPRPDVAAVYGRGDRHGFRHTLSVTRGTHHVCVFGINTNITGQPNATLGCRTVQVP